MIRFPEIDVDSFIFSLCMYGPHLADLFAVLVLFDL